MRQIDRELFKDVEAVIFDMDGTLTDSMWVWSSVDQVFYEKYHLEQPEEDFYIQMEGMSYRETARHFLDHFPALPHTLEEIMAEWTQMAYEKYTKEVPLKAGAREFLKRLKSEGLRLGIATSNGRELVDGTLNALQITQYFDSIHTACEVAKGKPAPDIYLLVAKDLGVAPENCLVFEDVPMGIQAGKSAGMRVCAIADENSKNQEDKKRALADYYIEDYWDIPDRIQKMQARG